MECVNREKNLKTCPCTWEPCDVKGICCECIKRHLKHKGLPACFFTPEAERTYDRSFSKFVEEWLKRRKA